MQTKIKLLHPDHNYPSKAFTYGTEGSAAIDICVPSINHEQLLELRAFEVVKIGLGFAVEPPKNHGYKLKVRSGVGIKGLTLVNTEGLIDTDYRGEVIACVRWMPNPLCLRDYKRNFHEHFDIPFDKPLFQLECFEQIQPEITFAETLNSTERGHGGFGSTDK